VTILPELIDIYSRAGYRPLTGYNPYHFAGWMDAPFTTFLKDNAAHGSPGMALQEVMVLEGFADYLTPANILIIGNSYGCSTIALSLIFPHAKVLALDPSEEGNELTRRLVKNNGLKVVVASGKSPDDVARLRKEHLSGPADLVLIDAIRTNEAMLTDFRACRPEAKDDTIWVFHDVLNWNMVEAFNTIRQEASLKGSVMTRTPSGVAVAWKTAPKEFERYVAVFCDPPDFFRLYRQMIIEKIQDRMTATVKKL
jgi:predicted O-methyltransferase YrrM